MKITILIILSLSTIIISPFLGRDLISITEAFDSSSESFRIFWNLRVPNSTLAFLTGSLLSLSGYLFQALFRNSLATPYTLGVASGASFGAVLGLAIGVEFNFIFISGISLLSFVGALLSISIVYYFARFNKGFDPYKVLLAGVSVGLLFSSFILLIQFLNLSSNVGQMIHWLMGNVSTIGFDSHIRVLPFFVILILISLYFSSELDLIKFNSEFAISRGVDVVRVKKLIFIISSLSVAAIVAEVGPIGFVGLLIPHFAKNLISQKGKSVLLATIFMGGSFLTISELVSRSVMSQGTVPMGIITALIGTPFFILLLSKKRIS